MEDRSELQTCMCENEDLLAFLELEGNPVAFFNPQDLQRSRHLADMTSH
jgi:hypothetical protein